MRNNFSSFLIFPSIFMFLDILDDIKESNLYIYAREILNKDLRSKESERSFITNYVDFFHITG